MDLSAAEAAQLRDMHESLLRAAARILGQGMHASRAQRRVIRRVRPQEMAGDAKGSRGVPTPSAFTGYQYWYETKAPIGSMLNRHWDSIETLQEYRDLRDAAQTMLKGDVSLQAEKPESVARFYIRLLFLKALDATPSSVEVRTDRFRRGFNAVLRYLNEDVVEVEGCAPLLYYDGRHEDFEVGDGLSIRRIGDHEFQSLGEPEPIPPRFYNPSDVLYWARWVMGWKAQARAPAGMVSSGAEVASQLALAMIAFKEGQLAMPIAMEEAVGWWPPRGGVSIWPPPGTPGQYTGRAARGYSLSQDEIPSFISFWNGFCRVQDKRLRLAAERLWRGVMSRDNRDVILEFVIGLEAVYGPLGQELQFRLAGRAAAALGDSPNKREQVHTQTLEAYKCRSGVVHGKEAETSRDVCANAERILRESVALWVREPTIMNNLTALDTRLVRGQ